MQLLPDLYQRFTDLIYKKTGILFEANKQYFVERRLNERIEALGLESFREYYHILKFANDDFELQHIINLLTINETYFFRDFPQLQGFAEGVIPEIVKRKEAVGSRKLKVWSAGCSTGEEPYTLAIILLEMLPDPKNWEIEITATDINTRVLDFARKGLYSARSVKDVPPEYLATYFSRRMDNYLLNIKVRNMVNFQVLNLVDTPSMKEFVNYDVIFCRNVLIYFSPESRKKVVEGYYHSLTSGGYIYLGHSESVGRITDIFRMKRIDSQLVYYKP